jgi:hypothetical protein
MPRFVYRNGVFYDPSSLLRGERPLIFSKFMLKSFPHLGSKIRQQKVDKDHRYHSRDTAGFACGISLLV